MLVSVLLPPSIKSVLKQPHLSESSMGYVPINKLAEMPISPIDSLHQ